MATIIAAFAIGFISAISGIPRMKERADELDLSPVTSASASGISMGILIKRKIM
jgi:hypothetical protein